MRLMKHCKSMCVQRGATFTDCSAYVIEGIYKKQLFDSNLAYR